MGHDDWLDMSDFVVHFTRPDDGRSGYQNSLSILGGGRIDALNPFGSATNLPLGDTQDCVCFSEIPLGYLNRLVSRRSRFGVGFHRSTLIERGGGRVWYLDPYTPQSAAFREMVRLAMVGGVDPDDEIWRLTPFVDQLAANYRFEWEREWRCVGNFDFSPDEVAFIFVPEDLVGAATAFLATGGDNTGPAYCCPILDPSWGIEELHNALLAVGT